MGGFLFERSESQALLIAKEVMNMSHEICSGASPWKATAEVIHASLSLHQRGISIAEMSKSEVLRKYRDLVEEPLETIEAPENKVK